MKETRFIQQKKDNWQELENLLAEKNPNPDRLSELFVEVTDDLSYARTYYGNRVVRVYLNQLTQNLFRKLFKNSVNHFRKFRQFVSNDLPLSVHHSYRPLVLALVVFIVSAAIGVFTAYHDPDFSAGILGSGYIQTTDGNIAAGDPMAVYKDENYLYMFLRIAQNNLLVAYRTFIFGLLFSIGSLAILVFNGIMVGVFQYYFLQKGIVWDSVLTIWMHGAMEIPAIIISGGAGLVLGSGLVFPGTFTRLQALRISARRAMKIMAGITPVIVIAAFIETFLTRRTDLPYSLRALFILAQLGFLFFYFVWLPYRKGNQLQASSLREENMPVPAPVENELKEMTPGGDIFSVTFRLYFYFLNDIFRKFAIPLLVGIACTAALTLLVNTEAGLYYAGIFIVKLTELLSLDNSKLLILFPPTGITLVLLAAGKVWRSKPAFCPPWYQMPSHSKKLGIHRIVSTFLISLLASVPLVMDGSEGIWLFVLLAPPFIFVASGIQVLAQINFRSIKELFSLFLQTPVFIAYSFFSLLFPACMILLLSDLTSQLFSLDFIHSLFLFNDESFRIVNVSIITGLLFTALSVAFLLIATGMLIAYYSATERIHAPGLKQKLQSLDLIKTE